MEDNVKEVTSMALAIPDQAKKIATIETEVDFIRAGEILLTIKDIRKKIENTFKPIKQKMDAAKREVLDQERAADKPLADAEAWLKPMIAHYNAEQEKKRRDEEARLRKEAEKLEEEARLLAAIEAEESGEPEMAQAILDEPMPVQTVVVTKSTPKVSGVSFTETWKFRITDETKIPREYLKVDETKIGQIVRAMKGATNIPGVEAYPEKSVSAGRRAA